MAWDFSGADLAVQGLVGSADGFALRRAWLTWTLLHDGGRLLAAVLLLRFAWDALRTPAQPDGRAPTRAVRLRWLGVTLLALLAVPACWP